MLNNNFLSVKNEGGVHVTSKLRLNNGQTDEKTGPITIYPTFFSPKSRDIKITNTSIICSFCIVHLY